MPMAVIAGGWYYRDHEVAIRDLGTDRTWWRDQEEAREALAETIGHLLDQETDEDTVDWLQINAKEENDVKA